MNYQRKLLTKPKLNPMKKNLLIYRRMLFFQLAILYCTQSMAQGTGQVYAYLDESTPAEMISDFDESSYQVSLKEAINALEKEYGVKFSYDGLLVAGKKISNDISSNVSLQSDLTDLLKPFNLEFRRIDDKHFVIKQSSTPKVITAQETAVNGSSVGNEGFRKVSSPRVLSKRTHEEFNSYEQTITGTVTDENGEGIPGVSILVKGTTNGTVTDFNGAYSLTISDEDQTLIFSYLGYATQEVAVNGRSNINVTMKEDATTLGEVVVSALGFKQDKDNLGSTSSLVQTNDIRRSGEPNLINSLAAKASNVQIAAVNGDPGAGTNIRIRGANTISGSSAPLIIVDGIPISNSTLYGGGNGGRDGGTSQQSRLNDINPNDIESIQILKGASAASLWGSRAANGVVVITTKSGAQGKAKISYKGTFSFDRVQERIPMQTTYGQGRDGVYSPTRAESWGDYIPDRAGGADEVDTSGEFFEAADGTIYYPITAKNSRETFVDSNWDAVIQTGKMQQHDLSISGGSAKSNYFLSLGRLDQEGIIKGSDYERTNIRFNNNTELSDWLNVSSKAAFINSSSNRIQQSSNTAGLMLGLLRTPSDFDNRDYIGTYIDENGQQFTNRHRSYRRYLGSSSNPTYNNPLWTTNEQISSTDVNRLIVSSEVNISPVSWGNIILRGGVDTYNDRRNYLYPIGSGDGKFNGEFTEDVIDEREINFDAIARASFNLNENITLESTLGFNINDRRREYNSSLVEGFLVNSRKLTTALNSARSNNETSNTRKRFIRSNRGYLVLNFDFYDQLTVNLSGSQEAASSIDGSTFYPAADMAWRFTEAFNLSNSVLSFGKLRASWGQVGVQPRAHAFQTLAETGFTYSSYSSNLDVGTFGGGFRLDDDLGNPNLKVELKTEYEIGTDLRFFENRLSLGATYYYNVIEDILIDVSLSPSGGYDTQYGNFAEMENRGLEIDFDYSIIDNSDVSFGVFGNYGRNRNEVTDLSGTDVINIGTGSVTSVARVGEPLGALWGNGAETDDAGNFVLDANGFPVATSSPIVLGDPNPDWRGGLGFRGSWKGLSLNVLFEHSQGGEFSPRTLWVLRRFGTTEETANRLTTTEELTNYAGDVIPAGTTVRGNVADFGGGNVLLDEEWYRKSIGGGFGDGQLYNFSIKDATFTRLREISLGYTLDSSSRFIKKTGLSSITFTATGRNLFLWDNIEGIDPQVNQTGVSNGQGLEYFTNPSTKSFVFSISINY